MSSVSICRNCESESEEIRLVKIEVKIKDKTILVEAPRKVCTNCNQIKFDKELDQNFAEKAIEIYNEKFGIRGAEITALRNYFGVSQETFGKALGIAKKTIVSYENENAIPNDVYYTMIKSILDDKKKFFEFADINKSKLTRFEIKKIFERNEDLLFNLKNPFSALKIEEPSEYNGYRQIEIDRVESIIQYIVSNVKGKTKLAKTLFFSDMIAYNETAQSLTGLEYRAATNGPLPSLFDCILSNMIEKGKLIPELIDIADYTQYNYYSDKEFKLEKSDKKIVDKAIKFTKDKTASYLSKLTHRLKIWAETEKRQPMSFDLITDFSLEELQ